MAEYNKFSDGESKFNKSLEDLRRLSILQDTANMASFNHTWEGTQLWYDILLRIDGEIRPMLKPEQKELLDKKKPPVPPQYVNKKIVGIIPPQHIRLQLEQYHNTINELIIQKGLGFQVKELRKSFILPQS